MGCKKKKKKKRHQTESDYGMQHVCDEVGIVHSVTPVCALTEYPHTTKENQPQQSKWWQSVSQKNFLMQSRV